jgi:hypothetical protein
MDFFLGITIFCYFLLFYPIFKIKHKTRLTSDFVFFILSLGILLFGCIIFYFFLPNLYFIFFSILFQNLFGWHFFFQLKKEKTNFVLFLLPYLFCQLFLFFYFIIPFFQSI